MCLRENLAKGALDDNITFCARHISRFRRILGRWSSKISFKNTGTRWPTCVHCPAIPTMSSEGMGWKHDASSRKAAQLLLWGDKY
jgi:hypothetical protein